MKRLNRIKFVSGFFIFFLFSLRLFAEEKCILTYAYLHTFSLGQELRVMTSYSLSKGFADYSGSINQVFPSPPNAPKPSGTSTERKLEKSSLEIETFIKKLTNDFDLFKTNDLKPFILSSHPIYYQFEFQDSCGKQIKFQYIRTSDEGKNSKYESLVKRMTDFFRDERRKE